MHEKCPGGLVLHTYVYVLKCVPIPNRFSFHCEECGSFSYDIYIRSLSHDVRTISFSPCTKTLVKTCSGN